MQDADRPFLRRFLVVVEEKQQVDLTVFDRVGNGRTVLKLTLRYLLHEFNISDDPDHVHFRS